VLDIDESGLTTTSLSSRVLSRSLLAPLTEILGIAFLTANFALLSALSNDQIHGAVRPQ
jgi:hypothetical protein